MHRILTCGLGVLALVMVAGCATSSVNTTTPSTSGAAPAPSRVKQLIMEGCGWVTPLANIAQMISASPIVPTAGALANAVCQAVTTIPFADGPGDRKPRVNGVVVEGGFQVKPK